ncbi:MAG: peptidyl-prolyl cis-trans isomerase, partial [Leptospiraceae bacterium]|nr:peptidyl-prolyl cis-trans isomerase [Leptospiraceae bacterium]
MKSTKAKIFILTCLVGAFLATCRSASKQPIKEGREQQDADASADVVVDGQLVNRVQYIVGTEAITAIDIREMKKQISYTDKGSGNLEKKAINALIDRAIVNMEAEKQTIIVSELRVENEIRRRMQSLGVNREQDFEETISRQMGMPFAIWKDELHYDLVKSQLIRIALSVPTATEKEIETFYRQNKQKIGLEIRYREMTFKEASESETARVAGQVYRQVVASPSSFATVARTNPANRSPTRAYGGLHAFEELSSIAQSDRILAGVLFNTGNGGVSRVFRDSRGRYMLVKVERRRPIPIT